MTYDVPITLFSLPVSSRNIKMYLHLVHVTVSFIQIGHIVKFYDAVYRHGLTKAQRKFVTTGRTF